MSIPRAYKIGSIVIIFLWLGAVWLRFTTEMDYMNYVVSLTLVFTLLVLMKYAHDTSRIANEVWYPVANYRLNNNQDDQYDISFEIDSKYKLALKCWCKLNATVHGETVELGGFYSAESSIDIQPLGSVHVHFRIHDILNKTDYTVSDMVDKYRDEVVKEQLYMDVEFWYETMDGELKNINPKQPHYFNFKKAKIVLDV